MAEDYRAKMIEILLPVAEAAQKVLDAIDAMPEDPKGPVEVPDIDWESLVEGYETGETKRWDEVKPGERVEVLKDHGPVVEANVPSIFCAHRFEDGTEHAKGRDTMVRIKRDLTAEEKVQWVADRKESWARMRAELGR